MKRLNHVTQVLDDMSRNRATMTYLEREDDRHVATIRRLLTEAQKFILPDKGTLLYGAGGLPEGTPFVRLPYPIVVAETTWEYPDSEEFRQVRAEVGDETNNATRRISLAFEVGEGIRDLVLGSFEHAIGSALDLAPPAGGRIDGPTGYVVCCLYRGDSGKHWVPVTGGFYMQYDQEKPQGFKMLDSSEDENRMHRLREAAGIPQIRRKAGIVRMAVPLLPALLREEYGRYDDVEGTAFSMLANDVLEEGRMMAELCLALSCSNVSTQTDAPSKLGQSERRRSRKAPLFDYHVLIVDARGRSDGTVPAGGTHGSLRTHLRRGHLRRLPHREERIWINDTIVNPGNGFLEKDYDVRRA